MTARRPVSCGAFFSGAVACGGAPSGCVADVPAATSGRWSRSQPARAGHARPLQQPGDRHDDAQVAFHLHAQVQRDERVDAEAVQGCLNVQERRGQSEFAGSELAQVRLEQPLALLRCRALQRVVETASRPGPPGLPPCRLTGQREAPRASAGVRPGATAPSRCRRTTTCVADRASKDDSARRQSAAGMASTPYWAK